MKRIKAACITQTLCFSNHDGETTEYAKKMIVQEYDKYKAQLDKSGTKYKILSEKTNEDGSIVVEIKKQYNTSPVGDYLNLIICKNKTVVKISFMRIRDCLIF